MKKILVRKENAQRDVIELRERLSGGEGGGGVLLTEFKI